jgi:multisubunit Na+/H+ antiporter MnhE subunit
MLVGILSIIMYGIPQISRPKLLGVLIGVIISPVVFWYFGTGFTNTFSIIIPIATLMLALLLVYESILSSEERPLHHSLANHSLLKRLNSLSRVSNLD